MNKLHITFFFSLSWKAETSLLPWSLALAVCHHGVRTNAACLAGGAFGSRFRAARLRGTIDVGIISLKIKFDYSCIYEYLMAIPSSGRNGLFAFFLFLEKQ